MSIHSACERHIVNGAFLYAHNVHDVLSGFATECGDSKTFWQSVAPNLTSSKHCKSHCRKALENVANLCGVPLQEPPSTCTSQHVPRLGIPHVIYFMWRRGVRAMDVEDKAFFAEDGPTQRLVLDAVRRENVLLDETFNDDIGVDELASLVHGLLGVG